jgi:hypothetical protein
MLYIIEDSEGQYDEYRTWVSIVLSGPCGLNFRLLCQEFAECYPEATDYLRVAHLGDRSGKKKAARQVFLARMAEVGYVAPEETVRSYFLTWLQRNHGVVRVPFENVEISG